MTILEVKQGHTRNLTGMLLSDVTTALQKYDEDFHRRNPGCVPLQAWSVIDVPEGKTARWGHEWYSVDADQRLRIHSAQYDSSG